MKNENSLFLQSDNETYLPYKLEYSEVDEVWQYYAHLSFSDARVTFNEMLDEKLADIQRKVRDIHEKLI